MSHEQDFRHFTKMSDRAISEASGAMAKIPKFERKIPKNPGIKNLAYMSKFLLAPEKIYALYEYIDCTNWEKMNQQGRFFAES